MMAQGANPHAARVVNSVRGVDSPSLPIPILRHAIVDCKLMGFDAAVKRLRRLF
jgi:hypothetical protein